MRYNLFFLAAVCYFFAGSVSGLEIKGKVTSLWEENSFTIETRSEQTILFFNLLGQGSIAVKIASTDGTIKNLLLEHSEPLTLTGMKEWNLTVSLDSADCLWGCRFISGEEPILKRVEGYADTGFVFRFSLVTEEDLEIWNFTCPKEATFIVRQSSPGARGYEEQDLADDPKIKLIGAGVFNIEIEPVDGGGEFVAERVK